MSVCVRECVRACVSLCVHACVCLTCVGSETPSTQQQQDKQLERHCEAHEQDRQAQPQPQPLPQQRLTGEVASRHSGALAETAAPVSCADVLNKALPGAQQRSLLHVAAWLGHRAVVRARSALRLPRMLT